MTTSWKTVDDLSLRQGDWLPDFPIPIYHYAKLIAKEPVDIDVFRVNMLVMTHSCDFEQNKAPLVTMCPLTSKPLFLQENPSFASEWGNIESKRVKGFHVITSPTEPENREQVLVVHFRHVYTFPFTFVTEHVQTLKARERWRLISPYLEECSRKFGDLFSLVGVPDPVWKQSSKKATQEDPKPTSFIHSSLR